MTTRKSKATSSTEWFEVDRKGLAQLLAERGKGFAIFELVQNAWDEEGVTRVDVTLESLDVAEAVARNLPRRRVAQLAAGGEG